MKSVICKEFKIAEIADIHFGNGRVSPVRTYEHLQDVLYPLFKEIKLLIINGDTFDTLLNMNSDAGLYVAKFIDDIVNLAVFNNVFIRVVRGTFSHDRHQNRFFTVKDRGIHKLNNVDLVRVIDRITIEHFDEMNIDVLYCPDDQPHKDLSQAIIDVIESNHLKQVDLICSHAYYEHLLPVGIPHIPHNTLSFDRLDKYVSGMMLNGHVHKSTMFKNKMISSGSFERMDHDNDLRPVGMWLLSATRDKQKLIWKANFVENKQAIPFITFTAARYKSVEEIQEAIASFMYDLKSQNYPMTDPVYIRIHGNVEGLVEWIKSTYLNVIVTDKKVTVTQSVCVEDLDTNCDELPTITEDNLAQMVFDEIPEEEGITLKEVEEILNGL